MLVLSRKLDQDIVIDGNITIRILGVKGNTVRIGIDAPQDVKILRGELNDAPEPSVSAATSKRHASADFAGAGIQCGEPAENISSAGDRAYSENIIAFPNRQQIREKSAGYASNSVEKNRQTSVSEDCCESDYYAVSYRTPRPLHHNRLKELVKELTRTS